LDGKAKSVESLYAAFADVLSQSQRTGGASARRSHRGGRPYIPEAHVPPHRRPAPAPQLFYTPETSVNPHDLYDERSQLYRAPVPAITNRLASRPMSARPSKSASHKGSSSKRSSPKTVRRPPRVVDVSAYVPAETLAAIAAGKQGQRGRSRQRRVHVPHNVTTGRVRSTSRTRSLSRENRPPWNRDVNPLNPDQV
jgi:hypothetical protein